MSDTGNHTNIDYDSEGWGDTPSRSGGRPRRRGPGVRSTAIFLIVVVGLIAVALFLPPFSLADRLTGLVNYQTLDAANPSLTDPSGLTVSIDINRPGEGFGVRLSALDPGDISSGQTDARWLNAYNAIPAHLTLQGPIYVIDSRGQAPASVQFRVPAPPRTDADALDLCMWNGAEWEFVPARMTREGDALSAQLDYVPDSLAVFEAHPLPPMLGTVIEPLEMITDQASLSLNMIFPAGLQPMPGTGALSGGLAPGFRQDAGYMVIPVVRNFSDPDVLDVMTVADLLRDDQARVEHAGQLRAFVAADQYAGVAIDYRGLPPEYRGSFSLFITELGRLLHADGRLLVVFVPVAVEDGPTWDTGAYDWRALGRAADVVALGLPPDPAQYGPGGTVERMLRWAVDEIDRYEILTNLSSLSIRQIGDQFLDLPYQQALAPLGTVTLLSEGESFLPGSTITMGLSSSPSASGVDPATGAPYIELTGEGGVTERIWITTPRVLRHRLEGTLLFNLGGVCVSHLLNEGNLGDMVSAVVEFQVNAPSVGRDNPLALRWTVHSADGSVVAQAVAGLSTPFVWTAEQEGDYRISADLEGQLGGGRGEVAVPVMQPTPTPTPEPTATPVPVAAAAAAPPAVPAGSFSTGTFELGGHVDSFAYSGLMQQAGMTWVKRQLRWHVGEGPGNAAWMIDEAHGKGFKILLGIVGYPNEMAATNYDSYVQQFASFLGQVAGLGPEAIEVWNEMNIDREWPTGQIDPARYTQMLAAAYNAIKGANSGVMVISGALSPTGAEAAFGRERVWNDDSYYAGMAAAGAADYMDCIGVHYNEGIVSPEQVSGDPRDSYPTRYFSTMLNRAWAPFGGARPACFTELGYLTSEGYGALPDWFAWAQNVSLSQQAAWLASAAVLAANSGKVRLMIIWNVDFTRYDTDPMAGYAIVRAGGTCPACQTLASVR